MSIFLIFSDFGCPSGPPLATIGEAGRCNKGHVLPRGSQESPSDLFGIHFRWIWEVFWCLFDAILYVFGVEF